MVDRSANGFVGNLNDTDRLSADIKVKARTHQLNFIIQALAPAVARQIRIPSGVRLQSHITADGPHYAATLDMTEGHGALKG